MSTISFSIHAPTWVYYAIPALYVVKFGVDIWLAFEYRRYRKAVDFIKSKFVKL